MRANIDDNRLHRALRLLGTGRKEAKQKGETGNRHPASFAQPSNARNETNAISVRFE